MTTPRTRTERLEQLAARLGPERCKQALRAYTEGCWEGWRDCPVAMIYGSPGELERKLDIYLFSSRSLKLAARLTGLPVGDVHLLVWTFDHDPFSLRIALEGAL